ncbi:addiction module protein [Planctomycetota bacterium]
MADGVVGELLAQALGLPVGDRLAIANELIDSVEDREDADWDAAWLAELDRRAAQLERGEVELEDWEVVKARIREELRAT